MPSIKISVNNITPVRTASPAPAQDGNVLLFRVSPLNGQAGQQLHIYPVKMKTGKKTNGPAYTRPYAFSHEINVANSFDPITCSVLIFNMSSGDEQRVIECMDTLERGGRLNRSEAFITIGDALQRIKQSDLVNPAAALGRLFEDVRNHFQNADGPVAYEAIVVGNFAQREGGVIFEQQASSLGLTNNSAYTFEMKVEKLL